MVFFRGCPIPAWGMIPWRNSPPVIQGRAGWGFKESPTASSQVLLRNWDQPLPPGIEGGTLRSSSTLTIKYSLEEIIAKFSVTIDVKSSFVI